jgi:hypothetical protein
MDGETAEFRKHLTVQIEDHSRLNRLPHVVHEWEFEAAG